MMVRLSCRNWLGCPALALALVFGFAALPATAGLLSNGALTRDTETGYEWLDLSFTRGLSAISVEFDPTLGGQVSGFHVASAAEVETLFGAVGLAPSIVNSTAAFTAVETLLTFIGVLFDDPFGGWSESFVRSRDPQPFQPTRRVTFQVRIDYADLFPATGSILSSLEYGPLGSGSTSASILVRSAPNGTPAAAIAPTSTDPISGAQFFAGTGAGAWFDAGGQAGPGLNIAADASAHITHVALPKAAADADGQFTVFDPLLGAVEVAFGDVLALSQPADAVLLGGFDSVALASLATPDEEAILASSSLPSSFPIFLQFDNPQVSFVITSAAIPEPVTALIATLMGTCALVVRSRRWRRGE